MIMKKKMPLFNEDLILCEERSDINRVRSISQKIINAQKKATTRTNSIVSRDKREFKPLKNEPG